MRTITFSGYEWKVRDTDSAQSGPGSNYFSNKTENVWVDERGLHLATTFVGGAWQCAEVSMVQLQGFGTYEFTLSTSMRELEPQHVFAAFLFEHDAQELDIEFSGSMVGKHKGQFVVQPGSVKGNVQVFSMPKDTVTTHRIEWHPTQVHFSSLVKAFEDTPEKITSSWTYPNAGITSPSNAPFILNLWLYNGKPPQRAEEVCITNVTFTPYV